MWLISIDYSLSNSDTLTKYKTAARIAHHALETVTGKRISGVDHIELKSCRLVR